MESYSKDDAVTGLSELEQAQKAYEEHLYRRAANKGTHASHYLSEAIASGQVELFDKFHEAAMLTFVSSALYAPYTYDEHDAYVLQDYAKLDLEPPEHAVNEAREYVIKLISSHEDAFLNAYRAWGHADVIAKSDTERARSLKILAAQRGLETFSELPEDHPNYEIFEVCKFECEDILQSLL
jgi:hypothetical protein